MTTEIDFGQERPSVQLAERTIHLRASSLGMCPRAIAALVYGYEEEDRSHILKGSAHEGHLHERDVETKIKDKFGLSLSQDQQRCEATFEIMSGDVKWTVVVTGRWEGLLSLDDGTPVFLWENKSMSQNQFELWLRSLQPRPGEDALPAPTFKNHHSYAWQISLYYLCSDGELPVLYTAKNRNMGDMSYTVLEAPPYTYEDIHRRLSDVVEIVASGEPALHNPANCDPKASTFFCPVRQQLSCGQRDKSYLEEEFDPEIEKLAMEYRELTKVESDARKRKKEIGEVLKKKVRSGGIMTLMGYEVEMRERSYQDNAALDKFLALHGKTRDDFKKTSKYLNVNSPKGQ